MAMETLPNSLLILLFKATCLLTFVVMVAWSLSKSNPRWRILFGEASAIALLLLPVIAWTPLKIDLPMLSARALASEPGPTATVDKTRRFVDKKEVAFKGKNDPIPPDTGTALKVGQPHASGNVVSSTSVLLVCLASIYLVGLAFLVLRFLRCRARFGEMADKLKKPTPAAQRLFASLSRDLGIQKNPRLLVSGSETSAFCYGLTRCTVVVPESLCRAGQAESLRLVMRHELSHVANRDVMRKTFMTSVAAFFWFHPLIWLVRRFHGTALEELGDRIAAENDEGRQRYKAMLARLTLASQRRRAYPPGALGIFGPPHILTRLRLLKLDIPYTPLSLRARFAALSAIAVAAVALATVRLASADPEPLGSTKPDNEPPPSIRQLPTKTDSEFVQISATVFTLEPNGKKNILAKPNIITRTGEWAEFENVVELMFPQSYDPPAVPKSMRGKVKGGNTTLEGGSKPIVREDTDLFLPPFPKDIVKRALGLKLRLRPTLSDTGGSVRVECDLNRSALRGFVNRGVPVSNKDERNEKILLLNQQLHPLFLEQGKTAVFHPGTNKQVVKFGSVVPPANTDFLSDFASEHSMKQLPEISVELSARRVQMPAARLLKTPSPEKSTATFLPEQMQFTLHVIEVNGSPDTPLPLAPVMTPDQFQTLLQELGAAKGSDLIKAPKVTTTRNQKATVEVVREFTYPTEFDPPVLKTPDVSKPTENPQSFPLTPTTPTRFETRNTGVEFTGAGSIWKEGIMRLEINAAVTEFEGFLNFGQPIHAPATGAFGRSQTVVISDNRLELPVFRKSAASATVFVPNGCTLALGGMVRENLSHVEENLPLLGDLPWIGRLGRRQIEIREKRTLYFFITVDLIDPEARKNRRP